MSAPDTEYRALRAEVEAADLAHDTDARDAAVEALHARYLAMRDASLRSGATPAALPYPDPTDPVTEGADAIRALAEAVDPAARAALAPFAPFGAVWQVDPAGTNRITLGGGRILARISLRNVAAGSFTAGSTNLGTFPAATRGDASTIRTSGWYVPTTGASASPIAIQIDLSTGATTGWLPAASSPAAGGLRIAFEAVWDAAAPLPGFDARVDGGPESLPEPEPEPGPESTFTPDDPS